MKNWTAEEKVANFLRRHNIHGPEDAREKLTKRQKRRLRKRINADGGTGRWAYLWDVIA
jgi:hypothetical protein